MAKKNAAGRDIDFMCTKCKLLLAHTIIAMVGGEPVRVKCNTCHTERKWRRGKKARTATKTPSKSAKTKLSNKLTSDFAKQTKWKTLMSTAVDKKASRQTYSIRESFETGQILEHKKFGDGIVEDVVDSGKIMVCFVDGDKLLVHGR